MWWYPSYKYARQEETEQEKPIPEEKKPVEGDLTLLGHRNWGW